MLDLVNKKVILNKILYTKTTTVDKIFAFCQPYSFVLRLNRLIINAQRYVIFI